MLIARGLSLTSSDLPLASCSGSGWGCLGRNLLAQVRKVGGHATFGKSFSVAQA